MRTTAIAATLFAARSSRRRADHGDDACLRGADVKVNKNGGNSNLGVLPGGRIDVPYVAWNEVIAAAWYVRADSGG
jgi:hypothetical protein